MKNRTLDQWEKDYVRQEIRSAEQAGATAEAIDSIRRTLVTLIDGSTYAQIKAVGAWKEQADGLVLRKTKVIDGEERAQNNGEYSNAAEEAIQQKNTELEIIVNEPQEVSVESTTAPVVNTAISVHPKSGAWADYERSEIKEVWRKIEAEFINQNVDPSPEKRKSMRILCTPGIKCYLELGHIIKHGFSPENITAVEREKGAFRDFEKNATDLGVKPIFGDLEEVIQTQSPFDIVLVDFVGPQCLSSIKVLQRLPLKERAIVAITTMGKRESREIVEELSRCQKVANHNGIEEIYLSAAGAFKGENEFDESLFSKGEILDEGDVVGASNQVRDTALWAQLMSLGIERLQDFSMNKFISKIDFPASNAAFTNPLYEKMSEEYYKLRVLDACIKVMKRLFFPVESMLLARRTMEDGSFAHISNFAQAVLFEERMIEKIEKYQYKSRIGKIPSPFLTHLAVVQNPVAEYRSMMQTMSALTPLFHAMIDDMRAEIAGKKQASFRAEPEGCDMLSALSGQFDKNARITVSDGTRRITSFRMDQLISDLDKLTSLRKKFGLNNIEAYQKIPFASLEEELLQVPGME